MVGALTPEAACLPAGPRPLFCLHLQRPRRSFKSSGMSASRLSRCQMIKNSRQEATDGPTRLLLTSEPSVSKGRRRRAAAGRLTSHRNTGRRSRYSREMLGCLSQSGSISDVDTWKPCSWARGKTPHHLQKRRANGNANPPPRYLQLLGPLPWQPGGPE